MPGVAANETEAVLSAWLVEDDGEFAAAAALATVETDKAAVDVEAEAAGRMLKTLVPPGAEVGVGDPIAVLGEPGEQVDDLDDLLASLGVAPVTDVVMPERRDVPADPGSGAPLAEPIEPIEPVEPAGSVETAAPAETASPPTGRVFSSPLARKIAREAGLSVEQVPGSGPRGRVLRRDVDAFVSRRAEESPTSPSAVGSSVARAADVPGPGGAVYEEIPHSRIRRATARRLTQSVTQAPHFYLRATVRADRLLALRAELNEDQDRRISVTDLVIKAVAGAHAQVPEMNVTWGEDAIRRYAAADVAVAVATEQGLLTPVVHDAGSSTVSALSTRVRGLAERARERRLTQGELEGGSITVTNLGMYGVEEFAAIINPPQAAILAVGAVREEPTVRDGAVVPASIMRLTLSVDHRPVDGALAARWFAVLVELLERPVRLIA